MEIVCHNEPGLDPWQYRLAPLPTGRPGVDGLLLEIGLDLPNYTVATRSGCALGFLIGFPIDLQTGRMVGARHEVSGDPSIEDHDTIAEGVLAGLGGNFLLLYVSRGVARLYPDGVTHFPCVYDAAGHVAGSTAHAFLNDADYDARFDATAYRTMDIDHEGWFPAGLTAHEGIRRLLPNHYLDLSAWRAVRFWPRGEIEETRAPEETADRIAAAVGTQLGALVSGDMGVAQGLTAGFETRWLLACARPYVEQIEFVTVAQERAGHIDTAVAARLAQEFRLSHRVLERRMATAIQRDTYIRRGGHCVAGGNSRTHPSIWPLSRSYRFVGGFDGALARGYNWSRRDTPSDRLDVSLLVGRLGLPRTKPVLDALEEWRAELPLKNALHVLDLSYVENRAGPWGHAQFCCDPSVVRFNPIGTPQTARLMLTLPPEWKRDYRLASHIIDRNWPELMQLPINSRGRATDLADKVALAINDPRRVISKFRKLLR